MKDTRQALDSERYEAARKNFKDEKLFNKLFRLKGTRSGWLNSVTDREAVKEVRRIMGEIDKVNRDYKLVASSGERLAFKSHWINKT